MAPSVTIFHNVVWSWVTRARCSPRCTAFRARARSAIRWFRSPIPSTIASGFSDVDYSFHRYPMKKLYDGCYEDVPTWRMTARLTWEVLRTKCDLVVLLGYHRPEYWAMLAACIVTGKRRAVFCDPTARDRPRRIVTSIPKRPLLLVLRRLFRVRHRAAATI